MVESPSLSGETRLCSSLLVVVSFEVAIKKLFVESSGHASPQQIDELEKEVTHRLNTRASLP